MLNSLCLIGRLTADVNLEGKENKYVRFNLAFDNPRKESNGDQGTSFIPCVAFGVIAEAIAKSLSKGSKVGIKGSLQQRHWITKDGKNASDFVCYCDSVTFLDPKTKEETATEDAVGISIEPTQPQYDPYTGKPLKK